MFNKRIIAFIVFTVFVFSIFAIGAVAAPSVPTDEELGGAFSSTRLTWALQVTLVGMVMVFTVLAALFGVFSITKVFLYTIPEKKKAKAEAKKAAEAALKNGMADNITTDIPAEETSVEIQQNEDELVAVITAAIAATISEGNYPEFASGFKVVSFKRSSNSSAWNKK